MRIELPAGTGSTRDSSREGRLDRPMAITPWCPAMIRSPGCRAQAPAPRADPESSRRSLRLSRDGSSCSRGAAPNGPLASGLLGDPPNEGRADESPPGWNRPPPPPLEPRPLEPKPLEPPDEPGPRGPRLRPRRTLPPREPPTLPPPPCRLKCGPKGPWRTSFAAFAAAAPFFMTSLIVSVLPSNRLPCVAFTAARPISASRIMMMAKPLPFPEAGSETRTASSIVAKGENSSRT